MSKKQRILRKKNRQAAHYRKVSRRNKATFVYGRDLTPEAVVQKVRWQGYASNHPTPTPVNSFIVRTFMLNSAWDPFQSGSGFTVPNWSQMAAIYKNYIVKAAKVKIWFWPTTASGSSGAALPSQLIVWINNEPTPPAQLTQLEMIPHASLRFVPPANQGGTATLGTRAHYKKYVSMNKYLPSKIVEENDKAITTGIGTQNNPPRGVFLHMAMVNTDDTITVSMGYFVRIRMYMKWWNKITEYDNDMSIPAPSTTANDYPTNNTFEAPPLTPPE